MKRIYIEREVKKKIDKAVVLEIERQYQIKFPNRYYKFIIEHNEVRFIIDSFDFYDNDLKPQNNARKGY